MKESYENNGPEKAPKKEKSGLLKTLAVGAVMAATTVGNAEAQTVKAPSEQKKISTKDMQYYKNVTENGKPLENGVRRTDITPDDTVVKNVFPLKYADDSLVLREHFPKKGHPKPPLVKRPAEIRVTQSGDTLKKFELISKSLNDTIRFTDVVPSKLGPRPHAPKNLGEVNARARPSKGGDVFVTHKGKLKLKGAKDTYASKPSAKPATPAFKYYPPGDLQHMNMSIATEESVAEKPAEKFTTRLGGVVVNEMTGDAHAFVRSNTQNFYDWLMNKKNLEHLTPAQWEEEQQTWELVKSKMQEVASYTNFEPAGRDNVSFSEKFKIVDGLMAGEGTNINEFASAETQFVDELEQELNKLRTGGIAENPDEEGFLREFVAGAAAAYKTFYDTHKNTLSPNTVRYVQAKGKNLLATAKLLARNTDVDVSGLERAIRQ